MRPLTLLLTFAAFSGSASATIITDASFAHWSYTADVGAGTFSFTVLPTGGVGGSAGVGTYLSDANGGLGIAIKTDYTNTAALSSSTWKLEFDAYDPPQDWGAHVGLALKQGANVYIWNCCSTPEIHWQYSSYTHFSMNSSFNPAFFIAVVGSGAPDFSAGVHTQFGLFFNQNGHPGFAGTVHVDNFTLTGPNLNEPALATPEPATWASGFSAMLLALWSRRKRVEVSD